MQLRASHKLCLLWSSSIMLHSVSSFVAPTRFATVQAKSMGTKLWSGPALTKTHYRPLVSMQSAAIALDDQLSANDVSNTNKPRDETVRLYQKLPKEPRVLKTIGPFRRSMQDIEYLTGAFAFLGRHTAGRAAATAFTDGFNPFALVMTSIFLPRVMSLVASPSPITVEEGAEMVSKDSATGKLRVNRLVSSKAGAERLAYLLLEDLDNVRQGIYPMPSELRVQSQASADAVSEAVQSLAFAAQSYMGQPEAVAGQRSGELERLAAGLELPEYYLHDFHSLPGGFLSPAHARAYDTLSELVFLGAHRMGRRMLLPPLHRHIARRGPAHAGGQGLKLLDVGTGPGSFLAQVQEAFPRLELHGLDLSPAMLAEARAQLPAHPSVRRAPAPPPRLVRGSMEAIPAAAEEFDFVTHTNCFHEMPEAAIRRTARELQRVLKPGGLVVHMDAMQEEDDASMTASSKVNFDGKFEEPYMRAWMEQVDMDAIFAAAGFVPDAPARPFFVSTLRVYRKPLHAPSAPQAEA